MRVIKRYSNRKLYDTEVSCYITLEKIGEMIRDGVDVVVIDNTTGEDISRQTLAQIILTFEKKESNFMPINFMKELLQKGSDSMIGYIRKSVTVSKETVTQWHDELERFIDRLIAKGVMTEEEGARLLQGVIEKAGRGRSTIERKIDERMQVMLEKLNIPTTNEIKLLKGKIDDLVAKIDRLTTELETGN